MAAELDGCTGARARELAMALYVAAEGAALSGGPNSAFVAGGGVSALVTLARSALGGGDLGGGCASECAAGHPLAWTDSAEGGYAGGWSCDVCGRGAGGGSARLHCGLCGFDACAGGNVGPPDAFVLHHVAKVCRRACNSSRSPARAMLLFA